MALIKTAPLSSGVSGEYHRVHGLRWDPLAKEFQCAIALYASEADMTGGSTALVDEFARFRLSGDSFETYVGKAALVAGVGLGKDFVELIYDAIKAVCAEYESEGETNPERYVKCDLGNGFYSDAADD